jgi:MFS family permease
MGLFCFTLPHTPPAKGAEKNASFEAMGEVRRQPLLTLFLLAVPVSCIHQFYFVHTEAFLGARQLAAPAWTKSLFGAGGGGLMTIGQMSEVLVLGAIPLVAKKVSRKLLLGVGLAAYAARMALFAYVDAIPLPTTATLLLGVAMHGLCFGCFVFVAFMVVDEETTADVRASAQSLFNLVIVGIGVIVGSKIAGWVADWATGADGIDYRRLFSVPLWASLACFVLLFLFYPARSARRPVTA